MEDKKTGECTSFFSRRFGLRNMYAKEKKLTKVKQLVIDS